MPLPALTPLLHVQLPAEVHPGRLIRSPNVRSSQDEASWKPGACSFIRVPRVPGQRLGGSRAAAEPQAGTRTSLEPHMQVTAAQAVEAWPFRPTFWVAGAGAGLDGGA